MTGKISEDADAGDLGGSELIPVVAGGVNKTTTPNKIMAMLAAIAHAATSKATPVDADELVLVDSEASNILKKLTWANLKATLKSAFFTSGTWTPELKFGGANSGMTYTSHTGSYLRIFGKLVIYTGTVQLSAKGSSTGTAQISGVPVASDGSKAAASIAYYSGLSGLTGTLLLGINVAAADVFSITQTGATGAAVLSDTSFTNSSRIDFSGFYIAA